MIKIEKVLKWVNRAFIEGRLPAFEMLNILSSPFGIVIVCSVTWVSYKF